MYILHVYIEKPDTPESCCQNVVAEILGTPSATYIYIYMYREREIDICVQYIYIYIYIIERYIYMVYISIYIQRGIYLSLSLSLSLYLYIYIYIYRRLEDQTCPETSWPTRPENICKASLSLPDLSKFGKRRHMYRTCTQP